MQEILANLLPVFGYFALGLLLRAVGFADAGQARFLLKFVFFVTLPCMVLVKIAAVTLSGDKVLLPLINIGVNLACMALVLLLARVRNIKRSELGSMLISAMIVNNAFMFPFILAGFGDAGFADAVLFDFGNAILTATLTYGLAFRYGPDNHGAGTLLIKTLQSPLIWSLLLAVLLSLGHIPLPRLALGFLSPLGDMTSPLILIALGVFFSPRFGRLGLIGLTLAVRMLAGLAVGLGLGRLLGLEGSTLAVVALCSAAPVGFNALTFASLSKLDTELAAEILSLSIFLGVIYIPVLMFLFQ